MPTDDLFAKPKRSGLSPTKLAPRVSPAVRAGSDKDVRTAFNQFQTKRIRTVRVRGT